MGSNSIPTLNAKWTSSGLVLTKVSDGSTVATITTTGISLPSGSSLALATGADITVNGDSLVDEIAALSGLDSGELGVLNGVTAGTGLASKALILDASGNVAMPATGVIGLSRAALAAAGAGADASDAAVIATQISAVTGADGTVGVALPTAATTEGPILVINTSATATLKVWPVASGDDAINGLGANTAFVMGAGKAGWFIPTSATQWYVQDTAAVTSTTTELNYVDVTTPGTQQASKAIITDANVNSGISKVTELHIGATGAETQVTSTAAELNYLDLTTGPGTQEASKAVVADANVNTGVSKVTELHIGATGAETQVTSTAAELNYLDLTTGPGTQEASKAVVADANVNTGVSKVTELHIGATGAETQVTATAAELNYNDITALGTAEASKTVTADANIDVGGLRNVTATGYFDAPALKVDAVTVSPLKWVDIAVTAALLDAAGTAVVITGVAGDQYKVRDIILVGGGTNFGAGGDRLINLTDGTTVYTQIANADIETAPAASLKWGDTKVPLLTGTSNTATVAGQDLRFVYSGGTTDHGGVGSITFSVCLEKVA